MIKSLLFDLDNTLYPETKANDENIRSRMIQFIADLANISYDQAFLLRQDGLTRHGTTLEFIQHEIKKIDCADFFQAVHPPTEIQDLPEQPHIRELLDSITLPKAVLTNAPLVHSQRVLDFYGITDCFIHISNIETNNLRGKPYPQAYLNTLAKAHFTLDETLFFDDHPKYTKGYTALGGKSVLIDLNDSYKNYDFKGLEPAYILKSIYQIPEIIGEK